MGSCNTYSGNLSKVPVRFLQAVFRFHGYVQWAQRMNLLVKWDCQRVAKFKLCLVEKE